MYKNIPESKHDSFCKRVINVQSAFKSYQCPTTKEEYWQVVDDYWSNLLDIILMFGPENIINADSDNVVEKLAVVATRYKENRDIRLVDFFNKSWSSAPDDGEIHLIPTWHILCDLCSESYLVIEN
jgi:hypothetical protein